MENMGEKIEKCIAGWKTELIGKQIIIYGCTAFTKRIYIALQKNNILPDAIIDNDNKKIGKKYLGLSIFLPEQMLVPYDSSIVIIVCSRHEKDMLDSLYDLGYKEKNVWHISSELETYKVDALEYVNEQMNYVNKGVRCYKKLLDYCGGNGTILLTPKASGDVFIACAYLKAWCKENKIRNYLLVCTNSNIVDVVKMYKLDNRCQVISDEEIENLKRAFMFLGDRLNIKMLSEWSLRIRNSYFPMNKGPITFKDKFQYETFQLCKDITPEYPDLCEKINRKKFEHLIKGKTIIIAPYAYSSPAAIVPDSVWEKIVNNLLEMGYRIYTVGYGEGEKPIKNTERIQFTYIEAQSVLEYAGGFIASRSGLCDIVHAARCRQLIIYGRNIRNEYAVDFFNMKRNFPDFSGKEFVFDDYEEKDFISSVIEYFKN